jgi:hypothetical protein
VNSDKEYDRLADKEEDVELLTEVIMTAFPDLYRVDSETGQPYIIVDRIRFDLTPYDDVTEEIFLEDKWNET